MDNGEKVTQLVQVCRIIVTFPVQTDEQALAVKRQIADTISELPDGQIQFTLMTLPPNVMPPSK